MYRLMKLLTSPHVRLDKTTYSSAWLRTAQFLLDKSVPTTIGVTNMILFFLICGFLQTLWGKPLPSPLGPSFEVAANATCITSCEQCPAVPVDGGQQLRSVYDIVQSCLFTIFACVWTSIHPNINGPRDSWWTCTKRRVVTTLYAVIAPEMVLLWALNQRFAAKDIADQYNKKFRTLREKETSIREKFGQLFQPLPKSTTQRSAKQPWTVTHGFFIQMGGFILYEGEYPKEVLDYDGLEGLLQKKAIDAPTVTERDLQDKSKGDTISKAIVVLQATWFVLQCIVRSVQHLPLSELEVLTLAFAVMNGAIYAAWWSKPQGVDMAICLPLKHLGETVASLDINPISSRQTDHQQSGDDQPLIQSEDDKDGWLQSMLRKDRARYSSPAFLLVRLPYRAFTWILRSIGKMGSPNKTQKQLRVPMFYGGDEHNMLPTYIACTVGIIFGATHLLGWSLQFPSPRERTLWQISAIVLTATPFLMILVAALHHRELLEVLQGIIIGTLCILVPFYIVARFIEIVIAFKTILHPPHNVLLDISWTRYIPHF